MVLVGWELGDPNRLRDAPHQVRVGDRSSTFAFLRGLAVFIYGEQVAKLILDVVDVRVDPHACLEFFAGRAVMDVVGAVLDLVTDVWLDPVPVALASVGRGVDRQQIL